MGSEDPKDAVEAARSGKAHDGKKDRKDASISKPNQHLQRYLHEFDFRYSNRAALAVDDCERTTRAIKGVEGKRLQYRTPREPKSPKQLARAFMRWRALNQE